jgi:hypothetical protein
VRFLPYNCTASKVVGRIFNLTHLSPDEFGQIDTSLNMESDLSLPLYTSFQDYTLTMLDGTYTACLKIYAVEKSTLNCVLVGISLLNLFVGEDMKQPKSVNQRPIYLNSGRSV